VHLPTSYFDSRTALRKKAVIKLLIEFALRLSELASVTYTNTDWQAHAIRVSGKGNKRWLAPFGAASEVMLRQWLAQHQPLPGDNIYGNNWNGIQVMLKRPRALPKVSTAQPTPSAEALQ
jgi:site-specific recombinase XerC